MLPAKHLFAALVLLGASACASAAQPEPPYRLGGMAQTACAHPVQLLTLDQVGQPYREVSQLSVACPFLSVSTCERRLLARGCELGADAIVITRTSVLAARGRRPNQAELADEAVAIRFAATRP